LADRLLKQLAAKEYLSFSELRQLDSLDPRKKISVACDVCEETGILPDYRALLMPALPEGDTAAIYEDLYSVGTPFVTTNYDEWLDRCAERTHAPRVSVHMDADASPPAAVVSRSPKRVFFLRKDLTVDTLTVPGNVVHLHGSVREPASMILTTRNYLEHYSDPTVHQFLSDLFSKYTVLFVGYGLEEDEIVEYILRKIGSGGAAAASVAHYRLFPRYGHEELLFSRLARYYRTHRGVELIGYSVDRRGDRQLLDVIGHWSRELREHVREQGVLEKFRLIDEANAEA
jgi:hypothetical protein